MKLTYRGTTYESNSTPAALGNLAPYTLTYRGVTMRVDPSAASVLGLGLSSTHRLSYRGTPYQMQSSGQRVMNIGVQPTTKVHTGFVSPTLAQQQLGKVHQANLLQNVQHRLQVAQERGDQHLMALLEVEQQQISA